jgi:hypothetical protein
MIYNAMAQNRQTQLENQQSQDRQKVPSLKEITERPEYRMVSTPFPSRLANSGLILR